jgi:predicted acylesterase/phospholipase RssA
MSQDTIRRILKDFGADLALEKTHIPFLPVATDLTHGTLKVFRSGSLVDAVCASSAFPGIYPPVRIDGTLYVDGGVLDNIPADICRSELGPRGVVVAISLDPTLTPEFNSTNAFNIIYRSIYIPLVHMRESIIRENSNLVWRIFASREANMKSWMDMLRFYSAREMEKFYQLGMRCAEKNLENLRILLTRESPASSPEVASTPIAEEDDSRGTMP